MFGQNFGGGTAINASCNSRVCFGFTTSTANQAVLARLVEEGTALLGPVRIAGRDGIRACIANYRTTEADVDFILDRVLQLGKAAGTMNCACE
jgi:hypothetical protein